MSCSWTGVSISLRSGHLRTFPVRLSWSAWSHGATDAVRSVASRITCSDELPGLGGRRGEPEAVDDVVEPRLEQTEQVLAGDPGAPRGLRVVGAELLLEQSVVAARLLLLAQLEQVLGLLDAAAAVLARRVAAALDGALLREAALALEEELHALPAADATLRAEVSRHARPSSASAAERRCAPAASRPSHRGSRA